MRTLTSHKVNGLNEAIHITADDEPGDGGANHRYTIGLDPAYDEPQRDGEPARVYRHMAEIQFQNGPIRVAGYNGLSNEALLAVVEDRLKGFQSGPFACRENALALTKVQEAMHWLHHRTRERVARGVEGTHEK